MSQESRDLAKLLKLVEAHTYPAHIEKFRQNPGFLGHSGHFWDILKTPQFAGGSLWANPRARTFQLKKHALRYSPPIEGHQKTPLYTLISPDKTMTLKCPQNVTVSQESRVLAKLLKLVEAHTYPAHIEKFRQNPGLWGHSGQIWDILKAPQFAEGRCGRILVRELLNSKNIHSGTRNPSRELFVYLNLSR